MKLLCLVLIFFSVLFFPVKALALYDPLSVPNNFHGIHILFPSELSEAASLVNSSSGEWGYVTIPIQIGDRDIEKWQNFMDDAKRLKIIPILRLSTEGDYFNTTVWRIPKDEDVLDFANFLNSLNWPTENRYIIVFNEMNRFDEWGGESPNPEQYADLLDYAIDAFKSKSTNFFIIMGGLDNASPNDGVKYLDNFAYIQRMIAYKKELFNKLDGFASHSYPNPGFVGQPTSTSREGILTYRYESDLINSVTSHKLPIFITETGWNSQALGETTVSSYYMTAYKDVWGKDADKIVAVTPFLLNSQNGSFDTFSFLKNGRKTKFFDSTKELTKVKGEPHVQEVKGVETTSNKMLATRLFGKFENQALVTPETFFTEYVKLFF